MTKPTDKYSTPSNESDDYVLRNLLGLSTKEEIDAEEFNGFFLAQFELLDTLSDETRFTKEYILNMHRLALGNLYSFAGKLRTVNVSKGGFLFPSAKFLDTAFNDFDMSILAELPDKYEAKEALIKDISKVRAELLFIHPFREGNGRLARLLAGLISLKAGYDFLSLEKIRLERFNEYVAAVQKAAVKDYSAMEIIIQAAFDLDQK